MAIDCLARARAKFCFGFAVLAVAAACGDSGTTNPPISGAGTGAPGVPGPCTPNQSTACNTTTCAGGAIPTSLCSPTGVPGACTCPAASGGGTGAVVTAGTGATPAAGSGGAAPTAGRPGGAAGAGGSMVAAGAGGGPAMMPTAGGPAPSGAPRWTMMGYDQNNTYHQPNETKISVATAPMLTEKWRKTVEGFPPGSPVIADGKVFVMATGGTYAFDLATGNELWKRMDLAGTASLAYEDGFLYAHVFQPAHLFKIKASDGTNVWGPVLTNETPECDGTSSPIVGNGMVIVGHSCGMIETGTTDVSVAKGGVEAFDTATGMLKWKYFTVPMTGEDGAMVWSTVSIDLEGKVVFAATGNNYSQLGENSDSIHAIDLMTGMKKWKTQVAMDDVWSVSAAITGPDTDFGANPILATVNGKKVIGNGDKGSNFYMFDRETGAILWKRTKLTSTRNAQNGGILMNGAWDGKYFYVVSNQPPGVSILHALDPAKDGMNAWPAKMFNKTNWGAPSIANGVLFVPIDDDLYVLNAMTGEQLKMFNTGGTIAAGAAAIVDGFVVVKSGLSYAFDPTTKLNNQIICYGLP